MPHPLSSEERDSFIKAATVFLAAQEQIELAAKEQVSHAMRQSHAEKGKAVVEVMLAYRARTKSIPQIRFRGKLFVLEMEGNSNLRLLLLPESHFIDAEPMEEDRSLRMAVVSSKEEPKLTEQELADFRQAASAWLAMQEELELVASTGTISNEMRAAHLEKSKAVLKPLVSCYRRTNAIPTLSFRGHIFRADVAPDGRVTLDSFGERSVQRVE